MRGMGPMSNGLKDMIEKAKEALDNAGERRRLFDEQKESYRVTLSDFEKENLVRLLRRQYRGMTLLVACICCIVVFVGAMFLLFEDLSGENVVVISLCIIFMPVMALSMVIYVRHRTIMATNNSNIAYYRFKVVDKHSVRHTKSRRYYIATTIDSNWRIEVDYHCYRNIEQNDEVLYYEVNGSMKAFPWSLIRQ